MRAAEQALETFTTIGAPFEAARARLELAAVPASAGGESGRDARVGSASDVHGARDPRGIAARWQRRMTTVR